LLWLAYQSIGVIYGDIGTSPLYVYSSTFSSPPSRQDLIGVLSIIIWTLFMMVTVKYVLVILNADNNGEGGTFSTYSLLSRYVRVVSFLSFFFFAFLFFSGPSSSSHSEPLNRLTENR
jgi:KUP system potassium uptake protein